MIDFLISKIKEYVSLNEEDFKAVNNLFVKEEFNAGDIILKEGSVCRKTWFVAKGILQFSINEKGEYRTFVFRKEGDITGDIESFIKKIPSSKRITALEDVTLYSITYQNMQAFYKQVKAGERFGRLIAEEAFIGVVRHYISYYNESPEERYIKFVNQNKDLIQRIPQYLIASYLGVKPQSLCRIKRKIALK